MKPQRDLTVPPAVKRILLTLQEAGHSAYVVGGSVRDFLRGLKPHDWDICTSAPTEEIKRIFSEKGYGIAPTGMNFGTVTVIEKKTGYEITVFRTRAAMEKLRAGERPAANGPLYGRLLDGVDFFANLSSANISFENLDAKVLGSLSAVQSGQSGSLASLTQISQPRGAYKPVPVIAADDPRCGSALYEDLELRDFTVNAVAWSPQEGYVDPYGGIQDIEDNVLRCPGYPHHRLEEDPLRILRALRFSACLNLSIHPDLSEAIHRLYTKLGLVSVERITAELYKFMEGPCSRVAALLREYVDVFCYLMPELKPMVGFDQRNHNHVFDVWEHTLKAMEACKPSDRILRFTVLLHDMGKPHAFTVDEKGVGHFYGHAVISSQLAHQLMSRLRFDKESAKQINVLVEEHDARVEPTTKSVRRWINRMGLEQFKRLLVMKRCDSAGQNPYYWPSREEYIHSLELALGKVLENGENLCFSLKDLAVKGGDLMKIGYESGAGLGAVLNRLLNEILEERLPNKREALLQKAAEWLD